MRRREIALTAILLAVIALSGCQGTDRVTLSTAVDNGTEVDGEWRFNVSVASSLSSTDHVWDGVAVTGYDLTNDAVCRLDIGTVEPGSEATGTMTCDELPVLFAVGSERLDSGAGSDWKGGAAERIGRSDGTDTLLRAEGLAIESIGDSGPEYGEMPRLAGGVSDREVFAQDYARCQLLTGDGGQRDEAALFDSGVDRTQLPSETRIAVSRGQPQRDGETLQSAPLPEANATDRLRTAIRRTGTNGGNATLPGRFESVSVQRDGNTTFEYRYTGSETNRTALHRALLSAGSDDVPGGSLSAWETADAARFGHAAGVVNRTDESLDCSDVAGFDAEATAGAVYAVEIDGTTWTVEVTTVYGV